MKKRVISGVVYVLLLAGFYCLKVLIPYGEFCFDVLIYAMALIGTHEIIRATKDRTTKIERVIVMIFAGICIPACAVGEGVFGRYGMHILSILFFMLSVALISLLVIRNEETSLESIGISFLCAVYPVLLLCLLIQANHVPDIPPELLTSAPELAAAFETAAFNSNVLILFIFGVSSIADTFAFLFGVSLKKYFPRKFAPSISPNKTVVGSVGGLVGGLVGGAVLYFLYNGLLGGSFENMHFWLPVYLGMGLLVSVATAFGDLVESCIKRKVGIKDMGKIMPGHGGILDRIDGVLYSTMIVYISYVFVRMVLIWLL